MRLKLTPLEDTFSFRNINKLGKYSRCCNNVVWPQVALRSALWEGASSRFKIQSSEKFGYLILEFALFSFWYIRHFPLEILAFIFLSCSVRSAALGQRWALGKNMISEPQLCSIKNFKIWYQYKIYLIKFKKSEKIAKDENIQFKNYHIKITSMKCKAWQWTIDNTLYAFAVSAAVT
jgi:hypothetical protein